MADDVNGNAGQGAALPDVPKAKKTPMTDEMFTARMDELLAEAKESGVDYVGLLFTKYGIRLGSKWLEGLFEHGFSKRK